MGEESGIRDPRSWIRDPETIYSGSRGQKGAGSRIRICNTGKRWSPPGSSPFLTFESGKLNLGLYTEHEYYVLKCFGINVRYFLDNVFVPDSKNPGPPNCP